MMSLPPPPDIPEGLEHLLQPFVAEMVKDTAGLTELLGRLSTVAVLDDLAEHAHAMRGKAGLFGENRLYDLLTHIEQQALAGNAAPLSDLVRRVVERTGQLEVYGREIAAGQA
ncbi:MAG: Hpt domain-containing protein [Bacteroidota bacterium]